MYDWPGRPNPDAIVTTEQVGCFTFDPNHGHWHFKNYAKYQLLSLTGEVLAKRSKVGFCLVDDHRVDAVPGSPQSGNYGGCSDLHLQGISVGWADVYSSYLTGQSIVIDGIADGRYCLVQTADPRGQLQESDTSDNQARLKVRIQGTQIEALSNPC